MNSSLLIEHAIYVRIISKHILSLHYGDKVFSILFEYGFIPCSVWKSPVIA